MHLLLKREQTAGRMGRVTFKLWCQLEFDEAERALVKRYRFDDAILIDALQPKLLRNAVLLGLAAGVVALLFFGLFLPTALVWLLTLVAAGGAGFWWYDRHRETIVVRDLIHGRHFACKTVIDLGRKEAWLTNIVAYLRQVMESAKHWDGTETLPIAALPKDEAHQVMLAGV